MARALPWIVLGFALAAAGGTAAAQVIWEPPTSEELHFKANGSTDILSALDVAGVHVVLEETSFAGVEERLGGTFGRRGQAGGTVKWLCFYQRHTSMPWVIWLLGGEFDADNVMGFRSQYLPPSAVLDPRCAALPESGAVVLPAPLSLGQTRSQLIDALGMPSENRGNRLYYKHSRTFVRADHPDLRWTRVSNATVTLQNDRVKAVEVWQTTAD